MPPICILNNTPVSPQKMNTYPLPFHCVEKRSEYTAIIVEPRKHPALLFVLRNFIENLSSEEWSFVVLHGNQNKEFIEQILEQLEAEGKTNRPFQPPSLRTRIQTVNIGVDNLNRYEYSDLFFNPRFYDYYVPTEIFLIFQTDTMIIPENRHKINDYLAYDYVGAPWPPNNEYVGTENGNGGLSLRRKSKMLELLTYAESPLLVGQIPMADKCYVEDLFFCGTIHRRFFGDQIKMNKADFEKAQNFSVETYYVSGNCPWGIHSVWKYPETYAVLKNKYPFIEELRMLQI